MTRTRIRSFRPLLAVGVAAFALALGGCGGGDDADDTTQASGTTAAANATLRVGDQVKMLELPVTFAGEDADAPYQLKFTNFTDGIQMNNAFRANEIDVGITGDTPSLFATAGGVEAVIVAAHVQPPNAQYDIVAPPDSGIRTVADLKGKKVAYTKGTAIHGYLLNALAAGGLTQKDVTPVDVPAASLGKTLASGSVDAAALGAGLIINYQKDHPGAVLAKASKDPSYALVFATRKALADPAKRAAIGDFLQRLTRAGNVQEGRKDEWITDYYVDFQKQSQDLAEAFYARQGPWTWAPVDEQLEQHQQQLATRLQEVGELPADLDLATQFDAEINAELNAKIEGADGE